MYSYKTRWHSTYEDGPNWAVVYFSDAKDAPPGIRKKELVVPSKRWEATREEIEDYTYLYMLREAVDNRSGRTNPEDVAAARRVLTASPKTVLGDMASTSLADKAQEDVLKALCKTSRARTP